jgi:hypothetical protein
MSHRYPTRFQVVRQAEQPRVVAPRFYQTRLQTKKIQEEQRRVAEQITLERNIAYMRELLAQVEKTPTFIGKLQQLILLYQYLYDEPMFLMKYEMTSYDSFREATWDKMNEQEIMLLSTLQALPAKLAENNAYDMHTREVISELLDLMESVRTKYW